MFDYGCKLFSCENKIHYDGQKTPPDYDLSRITVPVALFYGGADLLADSVDVETFLIPNLNPETLVFTKKVDEYAHLDFT